MPSPIHAISELAEDASGYDLASDGRDQALVRALLAADARHFWHTTRKRLIASRLRKLGAAPGARLIELGCGSGGVAAALSRVGYDVSGVEGHRPLIEAAARRPETLTLWLHDIGRGLGELPERGFDVAALFDVIEHFDDPPAVVAQAVDCVRPGGFVVGTVPALMWLWTGIDARSGHRLRYSQATLRAHLRQVPGASVVEIVPFNRVLVPLLWMHRLFLGRGDSAEQLIRSLAVPPAPLNSLLAALIRLEQALSGLLDRTPLPGASLWFALRKGSGSGVESPAVGSGSQGPEERRIHA
jgi:SAM-dependent methyltransferase